MFVTNSTMVRFFNCQPDDTKNCCEKIISNIFRLATKEEKYKQKLNLSMYASSQFIVTCTMTSDIAVASRLFYVFLSALI